MAVKVKFEGELKRYQSLTQIHCGSCNQWLCVLAPQATYTGNVVCGNCGAVSVFEDSNSPVRTEKKHGGESTDRNG
jgi:uncharacterized Zn finger protein (UPF0148 family)